MHPPPADLSASGWLSFSLSSHRGVGPYGPEAGKGENNNKIQQILLTPLNSLRFSYMYYTYALKSAKDEAFYVGFTKNLKLRFEKHNKGFVESTKNRRPLTLVYYEACLDQSDATKREKYLKTYHGRIFLRKRLKSYLTG